jgi:hypothetical protein
MSDHTDALATAAHLHVLLRRKTGRITDTEWMASNPEYARAIVAFARDKANGDDLAELQPWADKLESMIPSMGVQAKKPLLAVATERVRTVSRTPAATDRPKASGLGGFRESIFGNGASASATAPADRRYVGGIR